jgi:hypothetical protein
MTWSDRRLTVEQIKKHYFFYGVDWNTIRQIDAPFVPHLRSVTDTSYFPTDELDQVADNAPADPGAAGKDLAFLGLVLPVYLRYSTHHRFIATPSSDLQFHEIFWREINLDLDIMQKCTNRTCLFK